jgi:predicted cupin superfamily sugar epimerase/ribosomal protein S18 acetylase RimI-like enzyme
VTAVEVRAASPADAEDVAEIWDRGWHDGHDGHVPDELAAVRTSASFRERTLTRIPHTQVALVDGEVAGFVVVHDDELEQVYVAAAHRGRGVASALMAAGLRRVAAHGHRRAWLVVAAGNARARRFYEREGWVDAGLVDYAAEGPDGPIVVPNHRYERRVDRPLLADTLGLEPHPEGGWYRQTWASPVTVSLPDGRVRPTATLIYFLLPAGESSAWHRVSSDELWLSHAGEVTLELGGAGPVPGAPTSVVLGADLRQALVPAGVWQRTVPTDADALASCLVSPGFDFADFELLDGPGGSPD